MEDKSKRPVVESKNIDENGSDEEELIFNPYNPNNVEITQQDVETILKKIWSSTKKLQISNYGTRIYTSFIYETSFCRK